MLTQATVAHGIAFLFARPTFIENTSQYPRLSQVTASVSLFNTFRLSNVLHMVSSQYTMLTDMKLHPTASSLRNLQVAFVR